MDVEGSSGEDDNYSAQKVVMETAGRASKAKGGVLNNIAWILVILQIILLMGGLYAGGDKLPIAFFNNLKETVQSVVIVAGINFLGIGALILSLIVWRYHKNNKGKVTTFSAVAVIIVNIVCSCSTV